MPELLQALLYDYVPDILERRGPHREAHLALIAEAADAGQLVMAGPVGDPPATAFFAWRTREAAEAFAHADPYVANGLVTAWRIEPYAVVTPLP